MLLTIYRRLFPVWAVLIGCVFVSNILLAQAPINRAPRIIAPANQSVQPSFGFPMWQPPLIRLEWDNAALPTTTAQYEVQIGYDNDFTVQPVISYFAKNSIDSVPFPLLPFVSADITLFWRVRVVDREARGPWSEVRNFQQRKPNVEIPKVTKKMQNIPVATKRPPNIAAENRLGLNTYIGFSDNSCVSPRCFFGATYRDLGSLTPNTISVNLVQSDARFGGLPSFYFAVQPMQNPFPNCWQNPLVFMLKNIYGAAISIPFFFFSEDSAIVRRLQPKVDSYYWNNERIIDRTTSPLPLFLPSQVEELRFDNLAVNESSVPQTIFLDGTFPVPSVSSASVSTVLAGKKVLLTAPTSFQIKTEAENEWRSSLLLTTDASGRYSQPILVRCVPKRVGQILEFLKIEVEGEVCNYPQILTLMGMGLPPNARPVVRTGEITTLQPVQTLPLGASIVSIEPNPMVSGGRIILDQRSNGVLKIAIYDNQNRLVQVVNEGRYTIGRHEVSVNVTGLTNGFYTVSVESSTGTDLRGFEVLK